MFLKIYLFIVHILYTYASMSVAFTKMTLCWYHTWWWSATNNAIYMESSVAATNKSIYMESSVAATNNSVYMELSVAELHNNHERYFIKTNNVHTECRTVWKTDQ